MLADRGYDSNKLLDYVYARGGEPTIPSRKELNLNVIVIWYKERHFSIFKERVMTNLQKLNFRCTSETFYILCI